MVTRMAATGARPAREPGRFVDIRRFASLGSTNDYLLTEGRNGAPEGVVAVADHQEAGRGRLGRSWVAPPGSALLVSVLMRPPRRLGHPHLLTVSAALAAADACSEVAGVDAELKWPNDLVVGERKLAGVLAEREGEAAGPAFFVVGVGLNLTWPAEGPPSEIRDQAVCLAELTGRDWAPDELLTPFLHHLDRRYGSLSTEEGETRLAGEHRARCATLGRRVRVELLHESFTGTAAGLGDDGRLLVDVEGRVREVAAGDVVHLRPEG